MSQHPQSGPRRHFNYSNVMSTLAVFLVVAGGTALAAALPKNSVKSKTVKDNSLKSKDLKDGKAVGGADVIPSQIQLRVGESCPAGQAIRVINVEGGVICEVDDRRGPPSGPAGGGLAGTYPNPTLAPDSVGAAQIADDAVGSSEIAPDAVGTPELAGRAVTNAKIASHAVAGFQVQDRSLSGDEFLYSGRSLLNFPSIAAENCSRLEIPIAGLFAISHVVVTPPNHFADTFTLTGKVRFIDPGTSRVVLVACNVFGSGAADPDGSGGNYGFLVIHDQ